MRVTAYRIGTEVPELQRRFRLPYGRDAFVGTWFPTARAVLEMEGDTKYFDPRMAPGGAQAAVIAEKRREDQVRLPVLGFGRVGWPESGDVGRLRPVLARIGVHPRAVRPPLAEWAAAAMVARPRRPRLLLG